MPKENTPIPVEASPAARIAAAVAVYGERETVDRAAALLGGANAGEDFLLYVGGIHAQGILDGAPALYWPELWGARALGFVWNDSALIAIQSGLTNQAWRVREMCARVVFERQLPLAETLVPMLSDEVPRVRAAAARALGAVGDHEHAAAIKVLLKDSDVEVRRPAGQALQLIKDRFGRPIE
ncbi:MAG TPA: HEAT repeat domain-containing protein [Glaciihabitans sp.]|nr:HEAT repeat domain-containing protein [Glaciihabitans sp.]